MGIFDLGSILGLNDDMAKARANSAGEQLVGGYVGRLVAAATDRVAFEGVFAALKADKQLKAGDVIVIAHRYNKGGAKAPSKAKALAAISKRFVEIVRFHAKNKIAEKARPW